MHPRTDIIVLVHNNLSVTKGFVKHLFANTTNFHLIFVDNGSTDGIPLYLQEGESQGKWEVISPGENLGVIKGRNLGVKHTKVDYFLHLDNDQYVQEDWLPGLFELIEQGYDVVGPEAWCLFPPETPGAMVVGKEVIPDRSYFPHKHCVNPRDKFTYLGCGGTLMKRKVYETVGNFDERFNPAYFGGADFLLDDMCLEGGGLLSLIIYSNYPAVEFRKRRHEFCNMMQEAGHKNLYMAISIFQRRSGE